MNKLTTEQNKRLEILESICINGRLAFFSVGMALAEIKADKLFIARGFNDFPSYCESIGFTKRYCNQLIFSSKVIDDLPPELRECVESERAAREVAKVPAALRLKIVAKASENGTKPVTSAAIKKSSPPPPPKRSLAASQGKKATPPSPPAKVAVKPILDRVGTPVPTEIEADWKNALEIGTEALTHASWLRNQLKRAGEKNTLAYVEVNTQDSYALANQIYTDLERIKPFAVCPTCQGKLRDGCMTCKERGYVSEFYWKTIVPAETKKMRGGK